MICLSSSWKKKYLYGSSFTTCILKHFTIQLLYYSITNSLAILRVHNNAFQIVSDIKWLLHICRGIKSFLMEYYYIHAHSWNIPSILQEVLKSLHKETDVKWRPELGIRMLLIFAISWYHEVCVISCLFTKT